VGGGNKFLKLWKMKTSKNGQWGGLQVARGRKVTAITDRLWGKAPLEGQVGGGAVNGAHKVLWFFTATGNESGLLCSSYSVR